MSGPRVLLAITVYDGRAFVAGRLRLGPTRSTPSAADLDVLVLDDAQPGAGLERAARGAVRRARGRATTARPRNLGIPRNVSTSACWRPIRQGYDHVIVSQQRRASSRATCSTAARGCARLRRAHRFGHGVVEQRRRCTRCPTTTPTAFLRRPGAGRLGRRPTLADALRDAVMDIPAGISFCIMMPTAGRRGRRRDGPGLRPRLLRGDRLVAAQPRGRLPGRARARRVRLPRRPRLQRRGRAASPGRHTSVPENEAIIDMRYPDFREAGQGVRAPPGVLEQARRARRRAR